MPGVFATTEANRANAPATQEDDLAHFKSDGKSTSGKNSKDVPEIKIFELGKIFKMLKTANEKRMLTGLIVGDAFIEFVRGKKDIIINMIPISPERVKVVVKGSRIIRYEHLEGR